MRDRYDDGDDTADTSTTLDLSGYEAPPERCHALDFTVLAVGIVLSALGCYGALTWSFEPITNTLLLAGAFASMAYVTPAVLRP